MGGNKILLKRYYLKFAFDRWLKNSTYLFKITKVFLRMQIIVNVFFTIIYYCFRILGYVSFAYLGGPRPKTENVQFTFRVSSIVANP